MVTASRCCRARLEHRSAWYKNGRSMAEECGEIFYYHQSPANQLLHLITSFLSFAGLLGLLLRCTTIFTTSLSMSSSSIVSSSLRAGSEFIPVGIAVTWYFAYYAYLDLAIAAFWLPLWCLTVVLASWFDDLLTASGWGYGWTLMVLIVGTLVNMLLQLLGHYLFESRPPVLGTVDLFEFMVMTPFSMAYYALQWIHPSCRREAFERIRSSFPPPPSAKC